MNDRSKSLDEVTISGVGYAIPERIVTNHELETILDTTDQWIVERTGIRERRFVHPGMALSDLAIPAARQAIEHAGIDPRQIGLVICATSTPDMAMPATAILIAHAIGADRAAAFDLEAACTGFAYGMVVAQQFLMSGTYSHALVVGGDVLSKFINWKDRSTAVLFGDGAGAAVLSRVTGDRGFLAVRLGADGAGSELISIPIGSRYPPSAEKELHTIHMRGREVYKWAIDMVPRIISEVLALAKIAPADLDHVILHQANLRIIDAVSKRLGIAQERMVINIDRMANTSAGTIPVALAEIVKQGRVKVGDRICMAGFGAGLTWAAVLLRWTCAKPFPQQQCQNKSLVSTALAETSY
ncbi:MAG: ketoacyl-ACP synthase III [Cyanobacteria bacterium NC_groundwater_1444_Ag_S-0.65um_54_12]|nr:ketoacyl-ACP synthase III [Cyanobacteria bacterium NC_groundwater_1444_Ag_S-0.65um_54_12]